MSGQVKRYHAHQIPESGRAGLWVHAGDFNQKMNQAKEREEALHAEAEALKQRLTTERGNAAYWKEQYQVLRNDYQRTISEKVGLRTELEAARGLLCDMRHANRADPSCQYEMEARVDAFFTANPAPEVRQCAHEWVDARNSRVKSGELCIKCNAIRPGNQLEQG